MLDKQKLKKLEEIGIRLFYIIPNNINLEQYSKDIIDIYKINKNVYFEDNIVEMLKKEVYL